MGSGVAETMWAGREGVLSKAPACSSPGGREMLRPPAWRWGVPLAAPTTMCSGLREQLWSLLSIVKWAACECMISFKAPFVPRA